MRIPPNYGRYYTGEFERLYQEIAEREQVPLLRFDLEGLASSDGMMQEDGIHPAPEAQARMLDSLWPGPEPPAAQPGTESPAPGARPPADFSLDCQRRRPRIAGRVDGPAHDDMVRSAGDRRPGRDHALLVLHFVVVQGAGCPALPPAGDRPRAWRRTGNSRPEAITPSQPASHRPPCPRQHQLIDVAVEPQVVEIASDRDWSAPSTARIFMLPPLFFAAASMMAWLPCTVRNSTPRSRRPRTAAPTVAGTSKNLRSANTLCPRSCNSSTRAM